VLEWGTQKKKKNEEEEELFWLYTTSPPEYRVTDPPRAVCCCYFFVLFPFSSFGETISGEKYWNHISFFLSLSRSEDPFFKLCAFFFQWENKIKILKNSFFSFLYWPSSASILGVSPHPLDAHTHTPKNIPAHGSLFYFSLSRSFWIGNFSYPSGIKIEKMEIEIKIG
jgi:hypothetical protein